MDFKNGKDVADILADFVNGCSAQDRQEFVEQITQRTHRTLQQGIMRLVLHLITTWGTKTDFDLRNEATIRTCRIISENVSPSDMMLPYI